MKGKGTVYLIHFERPLQRVQHYLGYTSQPNVDERLAAHRAGRGARLTQVLNEKGIRFFVVRVWFKVGRNFERQLKNRKEAPKLCPCCSPKTAITWGKPDRKKLRNPYWTGTKRKKPQNAGNCVDLARSI